jgi:hypothetical protein
MSGLYPDRSGLSATDIEALTVRAKKAIAPLRAIGLEPLELAEIERTAVHLALERELGRLTDEQRSAWAKLLWADVRAHQRSDRAARELIAATNSRLWQELPSESDYHALGATDAANHPMVARHLIAWHERRTGQDAARAGGSTYVTRARSGVPPVLGGIEKLGDIWVRKGGE